MSALSVVVALVGWLCAASDVVTPLPYELLASDGARPRIGNASASSGRFTELILIRNVNISHQSHVFKNAIRVRLCHRSDNLIECYKPVGSVCLVNCRTYGGYGTYSLCTGYSFATIIHKKICCRIYGHISCCYCADIDQPDQNSNVSVSNLPNSLGAHAYNLPGSIKDWRHRASQKVVRSGLNTLELHIGSQLEFTESSGDRYCFNRSGCACSSQFNGDPSCRSLPESFMVSFASQNNGHHNTDEAAEAKPRLPPCYVCGVFCRFRRAPLLAQFILAAVWGIIAYGCIGFGGIAATNGREMRRGIAIQVFGVGLLIAFVVFGSISATSYNDAPTAECN